MRKEREEQRKLEEREKRIAARKAEKAGRGEDDEDDDDEEDSDDDAGEADESAQEVDDQVGSADPLVAPVYEDSLEALLDDDEVKNIVFTLDARDPSAWLCTEVEASAKAKGKKTFFAITRSDAVPLESLASHIYTLQQSDSSSPVFPVSTQAEDSLLPLVSALKGNSGTAFVGFENSGRSSLSTLVLNALAADDDDDQGMIFDTTHLIPVKQAVDGEAGDESDEEEEEAADLAEGESLRDFDARTSSALRVLLRNKGKVERIKDPLPLLWSLLPLVSQNEDLMLLYNVPAFGSYKPSAPPASADEDEEALAAHTAAELNKKVAKDTEEFLIGLARVQGRIKKHGVPDISAAARIVLRDWSAGCLGYYTTAQGWTKVPKAEREAFVQKVAEDLKVKGLAECVQTRKEWRKDFVEAQKQRRDLHPSPAIGELRLKSAGVGAVGGKDATAFALWRPREQLMMEDDDEDDEDDEDAEDDEDDDEIEGMMGSDIDEDEDEELDSDVLVPDSDSDGALDSDLEGEGEGDEDDEEEDEEEEDAAVSALKPALKKARRGAAAEADADAGSVALSRKEQRKAKKGGDVVVTETTTEVKDTGKGKGKAKQRTRFVEPSRAEKRKR